MFTGRADELRELHGLLQGGEQVAIGAAAKAVGKTVAAATGMGGIGKTELAWQYVQAHRADYPGGVWWLTVRGGDLLSQVISYTARMGLGQPPDEVAEDQAKAQWCFDRWVGAVPGARLLVLDDVVEYQQVKALFPSEPSFRVLLTTRRQFGPPVRRLELGVLKRAAAFRLLRSLLLDDERLKAELAEAKQLCDWVGRLPLGIELVGRYLAGKPDLSIATLLARLEDKRLEALAVLKVPEEMPYQLNLMAAFELSWQGLNADGQRLGCLLSLFALAPIPWELVQACVPEWEEEALEECRDEQLLKRSLLERLEAGRYQLHQMLREAFAAKLSKREDAVALQTHFAETLAQVAATTPPIVTLEVQEQMQEAVPHLEEVAQTWTQRINDNDCGWPFTALARFYEAKSLWQLTEARWSERLEMTDQRFGPEHLDTTTSLNNLAEVYRSMGRYVEAEPLYVRALEIRKATLGTEHFNTATSFNNLALLYQLMGRYVEAEPLYLQTVKIYEAQAGADHPSTGQSLNNLATLYESMDRYLEAEQLHTRSLEIREVKLGQDHPSTAQSLSNLAGLYQSMGRYVEAESLYIRSLTIYETQLGSDHPDVAKGLGNLAVLYKSMGHYKEAELLYIRSLEIRKVQLVPEHPDIQLILKNFSFFLQKVTQADRISELSDHPLTQQLLQQIQADQPPNP